MESDICVREGKMHESECYEERLDLGEGYCVMRSVFVKYCNAKGKRGKM